MSETGFEKTTRLGLERAIIDFFNAQDIRSVNEKLDIYPTGRPRSEVSLEVARHAISQDLEQAA